MKFKLLFSLAILSGFLGQAQSSTYTNLCVPGMRQTASLTVRTGQVARIVSAQFRGSYGRVDISINGVNFSFNDADFAGTTASGTKWPPTVAGPATITVTSVNDGAWGCFCCIELISPAAQLMPSTAVVIPSDSGAPVNIVLESSTDLINWIAALPGTYGTSTTNRFFRVRAERTQ